MKTQRISVCTCRSATKWIWRSCGKQHGETASGYGCQKVFGERMEFHFFGPESSLEEGAYGILEPEAAEVLEPGEATLVVMPGQFFPRVMIGSATAEATMTGICRNIRSAAPWRCVTTCRS